VNHMIQIIIECDFFCSILPGIQGARAGDSTGNQEEEHEDEVLCYGSTRFTKEWWGGGYRVGYWTHGDASAQWLRFQLAGDAHSQQDDVLPRLMADGWQIAFQFS